MSTNPYFVKYKNARGKWKQATIEATSQSEAQRIAVDDHKAKQVKSAVLIHRMPPLSNE